MGESPKAKSKSEEEYSEEGTTGSARQMETDESVVPAAGNTILSRKEKRKAAKKEKRKQIRKELAEKTRTEEEARLNDPEEQRRIQLEDQRENERIERERREFEEREKLFLQELELLSIARKKAQEEEEEEEQQRREQEESKEPIQDGAEKGPNEDDGWEYVEEGPPEIIWQGNEIIVKKKRVKVRKKDAGADQQVENEDPNRPTSNPLPPQSEAYAAYKNAPMPSAQQLLESVAQEVPNFGTEQDKAHCPFHIKTGACRFGMRCNRVHFYPDKSCTMLIKNMYNGPGLAWEQDEGLEYTDEEIERCYEEFYEDVHTEFLKFGEIVNFKVCRNGSFHLRGNVYVHYKSLDSAVEAYNSVNGRYFAGKQVTCEFVSLTKWKIAICGEYMKSRLKTCSRGTACNFLHCFSNPGGDYDWANSDKPPPRYWMKKMYSLFGYLEESWNDKQIEHQSPRERQNSSRMSTSERDRYHSKRHRSVEKDQPNGYQRSDYAEYSVRKSRSRERHASDSTKQHKSRDEKYSKEETNYRNHSRDKQNGGYRRSDYKESGVRESQSRERHTSDSRKRQKSLDEIYYKEETICKNHHPSNYGNDDGDSDQDWSDRDLDVERHQTHHGGTSKNSRQDMEARDYDRASRRTTHESGSDEDLLKPERETDRHQGHKGKRSRHRKKISVLSDDNLESTDAKLEQQRVRKGHTGKSGYSDAETRDVEFSVHREASSAGRSNQNKKDRTDSRSKYDEGHRDSESKRLPKKKRYSRKTPVDEDVDLYGSDKYERKRMSRGSEYFPGEENDERDRWEPEQTTPEKYCHRSRSKLNVDDSKQGSVRSESYDQKSDEQLSGASCEEHSENLGELDSAEELKHSVRSESHHNNYGDKWSSDHQNVKEKRPDKRTRI